MDLGSSTIDGFSMDMGGASVALGKVRTLADSAPMGRAFAAISSLTDVSKRIEGCLEAGDQALGRGDATLAALELGRARKLMDRMQAMAGEIGGIEDALAQRLAAQG